MTHAERIAQTLRDQPDLLLRVAEYLVGDGLESEDTFELAEQVCVATFGQRVECETLLCGAMVLPGFTCYECGEWTAPA